ncbi:MAG: carbonic anhydrase family protein [Anaerolineae bacterium]
MKKLAVLNLVLVVGLLIGLAVFAGTAAASGPVHWNYESGEEGPDHWGELSHDFAACGEGTEQSPIDVPASATVNPADLTMNYQPTAVNILNNGHTVQVNYDSGSTLTVDGVDYNLLQFHFHALSEHTVGGNYADMEMHLVHQSADGNYAVVGVLLNRGAENAAFTPVWDNLPAEEAEAETIAGATVNAADLLPAEQTYYRYNGSFTTPPCTEGVKWFLMSNPVELSDAQVSAFEQIFDHNYRPVQPFNARSFLLTSEVPATLPETGGAAFPLVSVLLGSGLLTAAAGLYLRRRN